MHEPPRLPVMRFLRYQAPLRPRGVRTEVYLGPCSDPMVKEAASFAGLLKHFDNKGVWSADIVLAPGTAENLYCFPGPDFEDHWKGRLRWTYVGEDSLLRKALVVLDTPTRWYTVNGIPMKVERVETSHSLLRSADDRTRWVANEILSADCPIVLYERR